MRHVRTVLFAITFTLCAAGLASAESASDFSAACGCDRDCTIFGSGYRCNGGVCTVGGSGTVCTDAQLPDTISTEGHGADWEGGVNPPSDGFWPDHMPGTDVPMKQDAGASDAAPDAGDKKTGDDGGCDVAPSNTLPSGGALLALLLGGALALARRRRSWRRGR